MDPSRYNTSGFRQEPRTHSVPAQPLVQPRTHGYPAPPPAMSHMHGFPSQPAAMHYTPGGLRVQPLVTPRAYGNPHVQPQVMHHTHGGLPTQAPVQPHTRGLPAQPPVMSCMHGLPVQPLVMAPAHGGLPMQPHVIPRTHPAQPLVRPHTHDLHVQPVVTRRHARTRKPFIQRLPVEIRCLIFHYCSTTECRYDPKGVSDADFIKEKGDSAGLEDEFRRIYQGVPRWVAILLVCRDWYHIAVNFPDLWTRLDFSSLRLTKVFLERSKLRPLDVMAFLPPHPDLQGLLLIMAHFLHIRKLFLSTWTPDDFDTILTGREGRSAGMLEELMLNPDFFVDGERPYHHRTLGIHDMLDIPMPRLKYFHVVGEHLHVSDYHLGGRGSPVMHPRLRHLKLKYYRWFPGDVLRHLLERLETLPYLESLRMESAIPVEDELGGGPVYYDDVAPTHVLQLPDSLKELTIGDEVAVTDRMLDYVKIPFTTTLRLEVTLQGYWERTREERIAKLVALCSKIPGARHIPLATLEFSSISRMVGWECYKPHSLDRDDLGHRRFDVSFDVDDEDKGPHSQYTRAVASGLDFRGTVCLILDHCDHLDDAVFFCIFAGMKDLREISITSCKLKQILDMVGIQNWKDRLRKEPNSIPAITGPGALWPVLEAMTIKTSHSLLVQCWPILLRALEHRSKWRIDIKSLAIVVDSFPRDHIERCKADLKRFVRKVSIDVPHDWMWDPKHHH